MLPTCKSTAGFSIAIDGVFGFSVWLMELLIISGASEGQSLKSCFCQSISSIPKITLRFLMTLNFAANFLGLDSAATPFD
jgi:spore maturation protein SpmA